MNIKRLIYMFIVAFYLLAPGVALDGLAGLILIFAGGMFLIFLCDPENAIKLLEYISEDNERS